MTVPTTPSHLPPALQGLLEACKDSPLDDAPRLILADWLEEHGQPERAEFIRTQLRRARLSWYDPEVPELEARQAELLRQHADAWLAGPRALELPGCSFQRGLVVAEGSPEAFRPLLAADLGPQERAALAWVDTVAVRPRDFHYGYSAAEWTDLFASPLLGQAACLLLYVKHLDRSLPALARSPHLAGVRDLALVGGRSRIDGLDVAELARGSLAGIQRLHVNLNTVHDADKAALINPLHFPRLERVSFAGMSAVGEQTVAALAAPRSAPWRSLRLRSHGLSPENLAQVLASPSLAEATELDLHWPSLWGGTAESPERILAGTTHLTRVRTLRVFGELTARGIQALASAPLLTGVGELVLNQNQLGPEELQLLLRSPHLGGLEVLDLTLNALGDEGAAVLAGAQALSRLRVLVLSRNAIGPRGLENLARSPHLAGLQVLDLSQNYLLPEGWGALAAAPHWRELRVLNLGETWPQLAGIRALANSPILRTVQRLVLWRNVLSVGHVRALLRSPHLGPLTELDLHWNRLDDKAAGVLAESPALTALRVLDVTMNPFQEAGARALAASPHLARVVVMGPYNSMPQHPVLNILAERFGRDVRPLVFDDQLYRKTL